MKFEARQGPAARASIQTIQVCPKDLPVALRQVGRAENRAHGSIGGADSEWGRKSPMLDMKRREFIALVGGGGLLLAAKVSAGARSSRRCR